MKLLRFLPRPGEFGVRTIQYTGTLWNTYNGLLYILMVRNMVALAASRSMRWESSLE